MASLLSCVGLVVLLKHIIVLGIVLVQPRLSHIIWYSMAPTMIPLGIQYGGIFFLLEATMPSIMAEAGCFVTLRQGCP